MTDAIPSSGFSPTFLVARERANTAAEAERVAWEALGRRTGSDETLAWHKAHEASRLAQDEFATEVRTWYSQNSLD